MEASKHRYLIALGSNRRVPQIGAPRAVLDAAVAELAEEGWEVEAVSSWVDSVPIGPSQRQYANGAVVISGDLDPTETLEHLQSIEEKFGRERRGQRWRARTLDLGNPQLSMHSIRETGGTFDVEYAINLFESFFGHYGELESKFLVDESRL